MSRSRDLLHLLQLNGGTFPTGGFSQSWGLETYVAEGQVKDKQSFEAFLKTYLHSSIAFSEGPVLCRAYELWEELKEIRSGKLPGESAEGCDSGEFADELRKEGGRGCSREEEIARKLQELEDLSNAMKVTAESREGSLRMGKAFGRIVASLIEDDMDLLQEIFACGEEKEREFRNDSSGGCRETSGSDSRIKAQPKMLPAISYPVIYGCVCSMLGVDLKEAVMAYIFSAANTLTQSALKLIPLGNVDAQQALFDAQGIMEECCCLCMETPLEEVTNFCPGIDIASLRHEELPMRLYMS